MKSGMLALLVLMALHPASRAETGVITGAHSFTNSQALAWSFELERIKQEGDAYARAHPIKLAGTKEAQ